MNDARSRAAGEREDDAPAVQEPSEKPAHAKKCQHCSGTGWRQPEGQNGVVPCECHALSRVAK